MSPKIYCLIAKYTYIKVSTRMLSWLKQLAQVALGTIQHIISCICVATPEASLQTGQVDRFCSFTSSSGLPHCPSSELSYGSGFHIDFFLV